MACNICLYMECAKYLHDCRCKCHEGDVDARDAANWRALGPALNKAIAASKAYDAVEMSIVDALERVFSRLEQQPNGDVTRVRVYQAERDVAVEFYAALCELLGEAIKAKEGST